MQATRFPDAATPAGPPRPRRPLLSLSVLLALALCATDSTAGRQVARDAPHTDRPGGDFLHMPMDSAEACVGRCLTNGGCRAYTWVRPGVQGPSGVCWLKSRVPPVVKRDCCTSGIIKGFPDPRRPPGPKRLPPPESPNQAFCSTTTTVCGDRKGKWNSDTNSCDCGVEPDTNAPAEKKDPTESLPGARFEPRTPPKVDPGAP